MELVVTGLSNNPDYNVKEKQDFIEWYKGFFQEYTMEELQANRPVKTEHDILK